MRGEGIRKMPRSAQLAAERIRAMRLSFDAIESNYVEDRKSSTRFSNDLAHRGREKTWRLFSSEIGRQVAGRGYPLGRGVNPLDDGPHGCVQLVGVPIPERLDDGGKRPRGVAGRESRRVEHVAEPGASRQTVLVEEAPLD